VHYRADKLKPDQTGFFGKSGFLLGKSQLPFPKQVTADCPPAEKVRFDPVCARIGTGEFPWSA
jgi:hypothetical protein